MATSILSSLLSKAQLSIVSSSTGLDLAKNLNVSRVGIKFRSRVFRHMREDGNSIVDARVLMPSVCEIDVFVATLDDLANVNSMMLDRTGVYRVTSRGLVLTNMMMSEESIKQTPDVLNASPVRIVFQKLLTQNADTPPSVAQAADSSLLDQGIQTVSSTLNNAKTAVAQSALQLAQNVISNTGL